MLQGVFEVVVCDGQAVEHFLKSREKHNQTQKHSNSISRIIGSGRNVDVGIEREAASGEEGRCTTQYIVGQAGTGRTVATYHSVAPPKTAPPPLFLLFPSGKWQPAPTRALSQGDTLTHAQEQPRENEHTGSAQFLRPQKKISTRVIRRVFRLRCKHVLRSLSVGLLVKV